MSGAVTHIEMGSLTGAKTSSFFARLFGWSFTSWGEGSGVFASPTCNVGLHANDPTPQMVVYLSVQDIEQAAKRVVELGGQAGDISPDEPGFGRFCTCKDPEGVVFGLHQGGTAARSDA
ncbi:MAG: VOC family protein [Burkholderiaceae bacterium]|nr:MAG: VOC family protein [Burkholderiaceae bacterium]